MKSKNATLIILSICTLISILGTFWIYPYLPAEVGIHFNFSGQIDQYAPKSFLFLTALLPILMLVLSIIIPKIDPRKESYEKHGQVYQLTILLTSLLLIFTQWVMIFKALGMNIPVNKIIPLLVGILFVVIGNYLPRVRSNYTLGVRTPWALEDASNWKITQRIGGYCFILSGILIASSGFLSESIGIIIFIISIAITLIIPICVSYLHYRKNH